MITVSNIYKVILLIHSVVIIFHLGVITGLVPESLVWGGNTTDIVSGPQILIMEIAAIFIILLFTLPAYLKKRIDEYKLKASLLKPINIFLWLVAFYYILNTIMNIIAASLFENTLSILTLILSISYLLMAKAKINRDTDSVNS